jgi:hypothetical protein
MRSTLISLLNGLIQILLLYIAYRLCQRLLETVFLDIIRYGESDSTVTWFPSALQSTPERKCLPTKVSEHN